VQHIRATSPDILEIRVVGIWSRLAEQVSKEPFTVSKEIYIQSKKLNFQTKEPDFYILSEDHTSLHPHKKLHGIQRVPNLSTENQKTSTPAHSNGCKSESNLVRR